MKKAFIILFLAVWVSTASAQGPGTRSAGGCVAASSSGTTYTCNFTVDPGAYVTHQAYFVTADIANTGAVTWNVNSRGAKSVVKVISGAATALVANDIRAGQEILLVYDGVNFQILSQLGNGDGPTANQNYRDISVVFDGGGSALSGTTTRCREVSFGGTINQYTAVADVSGSATITIKTAPYSSYTGPASASDISNGGEVLSSAAKMQDSTLTGWTSSLNAGSVVCGVLSSPSTISWLQVTLRVSAN